MFRQRPVKKLAVAVPRYLLVWKRNLGGNDHPSRIFTRHSKLTLWMMRSGAVMLVAGAGFISYQVYLLKHNINHTISTSVLDLEKSRPVYFYVKRKKVLKDAEVTGSEPSTLIWMIRKVQFTLAKRLLQVAKTGSEYERLNAVNSLSKLKYLQDADYWHLAQTLDARTSIALARTRGTDLRIFLHPLRNFPECKEFELFDRFRALLLNLKNEEVDPSVRRFVSEAFEDLKDDKLSFDSLDQEVRNERVRDNSREFLILCLQSLLHHSALESHARELVRLGGLQLLLDINQHHGEDLRVASMMGKVLANLTTQPDLSHDIFVTGWIGILAKWLRHANPVVSTPASKALSNIDFEYNKNQIYKGGVYVLHPAFRQPEGRDTQVDIIFLHGLLGGVFRTWRQRDDTQDEMYLRDELEINEVRPPEHLMEHIKSVVEAYDEEWDEVGFDFDFVYDDFPIGASRAKEPLTYTKKEVDRVDSDWEKKEYSMCWPKDWLPYDCLYARIIGVNYDSNVSLWMPMYPSESLKRSIAERGQELLEKLHAAGVGKRPIVWVAHSMGGILIKSLLVSAYESGNEELRRVLKNTKGIVFYSTPHQGSHLVDFKQATQFFLLPSVEVKELRHGSPYLMNLHGRFMQILSEVPIEVLSFTEVKSTLFSSSLGFRALFVTSESADPGIGELYIFPLDHLNICKPPNRQSFTYQKVVQLIHSMCPHTRP